MKKFVKIFFCEGLTLQKQILNLNKEANDFLYALQGGVLDSLQVSHVEN